VLGGWRSRGLKQIESGCVLWGWAGVKKETKGVSKKKDATPDTKNRKTYPNSPRSGPRG